MATAPLTFVCPNLPASRVLGMRGVVGGRVHGDATMAYLTFTEVEAACALVNARGLGRVNWKKVVKSEGSGKVRLAGQFHGYEITSARVAQVAFGKKTAPVIHTMLVIVLTNAQIQKNIAMGGSPLAYRNLNRGTILSLNPA